MKISVLHVLPETQKQTAVEFGATVVLSRPAADAAQGINSGETWFELGHANPPGPVGNLTYTLPSAML